MVEVPRWQPMFREINIEIFDTVLSGTPGYLSPEILLLSNEIAPDALPEIVAHHPAPGAVVRECFPNVIERVRTHGGELVYGWAIWEWPEVFIEAEHHGVWRSPEGMLIDITPHEYPTDGVLFLPDPSATYDFDNFTRRDNVRRAVTTLPAVAEFLDLSALSSRKLESVSVGKEYRMSERDLLQLQAIEDRKTALKKQIYFHLARSRNPTTDASAARGASSRSAAHSTSVERGRSAAA